MIRNDDYFEIIKEQNKELAKFRPFKSAYEMKKEIERLNNQLQQKENIIKEVREYIERYREQKEKLQGVMLCSSKLLEILEKEK